MDYSVGKKLREKRKQKGVTILVAANDCGVSYQAMQAYESDERLPRYEKMKTIAKYYNCTVGALFFDNQ